MVYLFGKIILLVFYYIIENIKFDVFVLIYILDVFINFWKWKGLLRLLYESYCL